MKLTRTLTAAAAAAALALTLTPGAEAARAKVITVKAVTHNIAGGMTHNGDPAALADVKAQVTRGAKVLMLQEVCASQVTDLRGHLPGWDVAFAPMRTEHPKCESGALGNVLAAPQLTNLTVTALPHVRYSRTQNLLCGDVRVKAITMRACTTHVMAGWADEGAKYRTEQVQAIADTIAPYADAGVQVILGGDFNAPRKSGIMRPLRSAYTDAVPNPGIDYVWSANEKRARGTVVETTVSDHNLIRAVLRVRR